MKVSAGAGLYNGMTSAQYYITGSPSPYIGDACSVIPGQICARTYFNLLGNIPFTKVCTWKQQK